MKQRKKKKRCGKYKTVLHMHIGNSVIRRILSKYAKNRWHERYLFVVWTKKEKSDGAFDNLPRFLKDMKRVREALKVAGYYVYWPKWKQEWFPLLQESEQRKYCGWAERTTERAIRRKWKKVEEREESAT